MDCIVHGVAKSRTQLFQVSNFHFTSSCEQDQALLCRVLKIDQQIFYNPWKADVHVLLLTYSLL